MISITIPGTLLQGLADVKNIVDEAEKSDVYKVFFEVVAEGEAHPKTNIGRVIAAFVKGEIERYNGQAERTTPEYKRFKKAVLDRDGYCCVICGATDHLHVHHIKPFKKYPELRTDIDNGITLCADCHRSVHHGDL